MERRKEKKEKKNSYCCHNEVVRLIFIKSGNQFLTQRVDILTENVSFLMVFLSSSKLPGQYLQTVTNTSSHILPN
jgi:hypothetical protein